MDLLLTRINVFKESAAQLIKQQKQLIGTQVRVIRPNQTGKTKIVSQVLGKAITSTNLMYDHRFEYVLLLDIYKITTEYDAGVSLSKLTILDDGDVLDIGDTISFDGLTGCLIQYKINTKQSFCRSVFQYDAIPLVQYAV